MSWDTRARRMKSLGSFMKATQAVARSEDEAEKESNCHSQQHNEEASSHRFTTPLQLHCFTNIDRWLLYCSNNLLG